MIAPSMGRFYNMQRGDELLWLPPLDKKRLWNTSIGNIRWQASPLVGEAAWRQLRRDRRVRRRFLRRTARETSRHDRA